MKDEELQNQKEKIIGKVVQCGSEIKIVFDNNESQINATKTYKGKQILNENK